MNKQQDDNKVKLTIWMDRRIRKAFKVVCSYRSISFQKAIKYLVAYYIYNDGVIPKFDMKKATEKIIKYAKVQELNYDELDGGLDEEERKYSSEETRE